MVIWRLERYGCGPYTNYTYPEMQNEHNKDSKNHPGINSDTDFKFQWGMLCGFQKYGLLLKWFDNYLPKLKLLGFRVVKYKVPKKYVLFGKSGLQAAFNPEKAERL